MREKKRVQLDTNAMAKGYVEMGELNLQISGEYSATEDTDLIQTEVRLNG